MSEYNIQENRLDYFIAHAPEVPDWFQCETPPAPSRPILDKESLTEAQLKEWDNYYNDYGGLEDPALLAHDNKLEKWRIALDKHSIQKEAIRLFEWRIFYAEGMIQTLTIHSLK